MKPTLIIALCCAAIICSCKESAPVNGSLTSSTTVPVSSLNRLEWGKSLRYEGTNTLQNFRPYVVGARFPDTSWSWDAVVSWTGLDTLPNGQAAWRVHTSEGSPASEGDTYYLLTDDTLFLYAYTNASNIAPKPSNGIGLRFAGRTYRSGEELAAAMRSDLFPPAAVSRTEGIIYESRPPKVLVFPLTTGREWDYRERGNPFHIGKIVVGTAPVAIGGLLAVAARVVWRWDLNNDLRWDQGLEGTDEIAAVGLVERTRILRNIVVTDMNSPEGIGLIDLHLQYSLTSTSGFSQ